MTKSPNPVPLRPDYSAARARAGHHFVRACFAEAQARVRRVAGPSPFYGSDTVAPLIVQRAAVEPASTSTPGWAAELARTAWADFLLSLSPYGAAARLLAQATRATIGPVDVTNFPVRTGPAVPPWVLENGAIPVSSATFTNVPIGPPKKMAHILAWSKEAGQRANAEAVFASMLREDVAAGLDSALLAATAGSAAAPAGLLFDLTPLAPAAGTDEAVARADLAALATAVGIDGSGSCTFVVSPDRLARLRILAPTVFPNIDIVSSNALSGDYVVAVDGPALIIAIDPAPDIQRSTDATIHMSDTPLPIVAGATADPVTSLFQVGAIAVRVIHELDFVKRRAAAVAFVDDASW